MSENERAVIFGKNLTEQMKKHKITQADLVRKLGVSKSTVSVWCNGANVPRTDKIEELCRIFDVQFSDLLEEKKPADELDELTNEEKRFFSLAKQLSPEQLSMVAAQIEGLLRRQ